MKRFIFICAGLLFFAILSAQEQNTLDWDIDNIFDEPAQETPIKEPDNNESAITGNNLLKQKGITFNASYDFLIGVAPGWSEQPWAETHDLDDYGFHLDRYIKLNGSLTADAQIDDSLRILTSFSFEIPNFYIKLGDLFFDYNINYKVFFRGGKYSHSWGLASNFSFTNLLARVPNDTVTGDSFIFKADIPTGIGGLQILTLTRYNLLSNNIEPLKFEDFGFGGKYNLAFRWADFDIGVYYQENMPLRAFLSIKTTLWKTEFYSEGLIAINVNDPSDISGAGSFGFTKELFSNKFVMNGEIFYNGEKNSYQYNKETYISEAKATELKDELYLALNLGYKFGGKTNPVLLTQMRYAVFDNSIQIIPVFKFNPFSHIEFYLAVPMTFGSKEGYYYQNTYTTYNGEPVPFCVIFLIKLSGNLQFKL